MYVTTETPGSIIRFNRTALTGAVEFEQQLLNGDPGAGSLSKPTAISLTPSGSRLFISDSDTVTTSLYDRNINTGEISLLEEYTQDTINLDDESVNMINDGVNVIIMYQTDDVVETLRVTASAVCNGTAGSTDSLSVPLYMTPTSAASLEVQGLVHPSARGTITNIADIIAEAGAVDLNLINNSDFDDTLITVETDVAITKTGPAELIAGETIGL